MAVQERLYTAEELLALPRDNKRYELVEGKLIEMSPTGKPHGRLTVRIGGLLDAHAEKYDLGQAYGAETGFQVAENPDTVYGIDVAFVSKARAQKGEGYFKGAPDLAVEVVSPGNSKEEIHKKIVNYFGTGCRLVWVFYSKSRAVYVYTSPNEIKVLNAEDVLDGGDVLPGFSVKLTDIFSALDK
jgi:Uma2 family endonuclease